MDIQPGPNTATTDARSACATLGDVRPIARLADVLLVTFLVCLAFATAAQVRHNQSAGPHGRAPHDRPVRVAP
jgi:hypothetical protein